MQVKEFEVAVGWGNICGQIFGNPDAENSKPVVALHGFLDNSNSFKPIAPYLTKEDQFYVIAVDIPGMGRSSKIPDGIPYSTKLYVMCLRRVILHFKLKKFTFLTHSFGCSLALAYSACYQDEVMGLALIDFAMKDCNIDNRDNLGECWREGIDMYLNTENILNEKKKKGPEKELTYEHALKRLLESNKHIDEEAAKLLLERGLTKVDGKLEYTRDLRLVTGISMRDYHLEFHGVYDVLFKTLSSPVLLVYATPPPFTQELFDQIMKIMAEIKKNNKSSVELCPINGTHHFHMLKPAESAEIIINFLKDKVNNSN